MPRTAKRAVVDDTLKSAPANESASTSAGESAGESPDPASSSPSSPPQPPQQPNLPINATKQIEELGEYNATNKGLKFDLKGVKCMAKCVGVYDGDTITLTFPFANNYYYASCRCYGYNCAEIRTSDSDEKAKGIIARDRVRELILGKIVYVEFGANDKYGRPLATVHTTTQATTQTTTHTATTRTPRNRVVIGGSLSDILLSENLARVYYGEGEKEF
jgi:endonuclease YncB( thermonuclease family)